MQTSQLIDLVVQVTGLAPELCKTSIGALHFDRNLKHLDIWDMPLIPVGNETVLFIPTLVWFGNPLRSIENMMAQWKSNEHLLIAGESYSNSGCARRLDKFLACRFKDRFNFMMQQGRR